jgi:CRP/FNR family transcriptional regulator, dissimilatory nitrate respiration regulator
MKNENPGSKEKSVLLLKFPLFQQLSGEALLQLASYSRSKKYAKGEGLFFEGDEAKGFFLLLEGKVKVFRTSPQGRQQIIHIIEPFAPIGEVPAFEGGNYPADAQAITAVKAFYLERNSFLEIARKQPAVLLSMLAILSRRLRNLVELLSDISLREVTSRLARYLLSEGRDQFKLSVSKKLLSGKLGTIPETLSRSFAALEKEGIVRIGNKDVIIIDRKQLEKLSEL